MNTLISISEVQRLLNVSRATVNRLLDRGELRRVKIGSAVRIPSEDVDAFVQRLQSAGYDLTDPHEAWLQLDYLQFLERTQLIPLRFTQPHFGGWRWWMICPSGGQRVAKLYLPPGGDTFASREAWRLVYRSQRQDQLGRALARLDRIERRLERRERNGTKAAQPKSLRCHGDERSLNQYREERAQISALTEGMLAHLRSCSV